MTRVPSSAFEHARIVYVSGTLSRLMDGDPDAEAFGDQALPKLLAQGWRVTVISAAGKAGERHFHLVKHMTQDEQLAVMAGEAAGLANEPAKPKRKR